MARNAPAFQFYVDDFLGGTVHMSCEEVGLYVRLLCLQWSHGVITDRHIRAFAGTVSPESVTFVLTEKFAQVEGGYQNARLEQVRETSIARREAGSRGGSNRQANLQAKRLANNEANDLANECPPTPAPTPTPAPEPSPESISKAAASFAAAAKEDLDLREVDRLTRELLRVRPILDRAFAFRVCCVGLAIERGIVNDWIERLRDGDVKKPKRWLEAAIDGECRSRGFTWAAIAGLVKVPQPVAVQPAPQPEQAATR